MKPRPIGSLSRRVGVFCARRFQVQRVKPHFTVAFSVHDRQLLRASGVMRSLPVWPLDKRQVRPDRGYCGAEKEWRQVKDIEIIIGVRGTRNHKITAPGRALNRVLAKKPMQVEQNIGHLKNRRLLSNPSCHQWFFS